MKADQLTPLTLADKLGISRSTLDSILKDDWKTVRRAAIEKVADYVGLSAKDIFELEPVDFWGPFVKARRCRFLRGSGTTDEDIPVAEWDDDATVSISKFLRAEAPGFKVYTRDHSTDKDENELLELARNENCIVIGSPKSNLACEILVSHLFEAKPFDSSQANRQLIPFGFCWPENATQAENIVLKSSLTCSGVARKEIDGKYGIISKDLRINASQKPPAEYLGWQTKSGVDCGVVLVANKPFGSEKNVKLIVLAGYSGIGTIAAAEALLKSFRALEPLPGERCVYGIVEAKYSKAAGSQNRRYEEFFWRYRHGGRLPGLWPARGKKASEVDAE